jgi:hypothetical protein
MFFVSCANAPKRSNTPIADLEKILTERDFRQAVIKYLEKTGQPVSSTYDVVLVDLNGDYREEALIMMNTPFSTWCNIAGCTLLIFENTLPNDIKIHSRIEPVREPIFVKNANNKNGWKTLITRQDGLNRKARYIKIENNGYGYDAMALNADTYHGNLNNSQRYFD